MVDRRRTTRTSNVPAKFSAPRRTDIYRRVRLFRELDRGLRKRVVWIAAPAGAGKSCLVTSYVGARRINALWYNVDARDADVANLFHYLAVAARVASPKKKWALPAFTAENQFGPGAFARGFFEALCRQLPASSVIVLDDYQEAKSELWHEVVREAIATLPKGISIMVVSRAEPPAAFARPIASGHIAFLGPEELRLTREEMTGLVRLHRPDLQKAELSQVLPRILELADGWAAVLTLLLQNRRLGSIEAGGVEESAEHLFDYFAAEILDKTTPPQRSFLLKTSIMPSMTAEIACALTGDRDAARMLADLERRSFLTQRLGTSGAFRYHPLLRDFLRRRVASEFGEVAVREIHRRAGELLDRAGQIDEAMEQYQAAHALDEVVALLLRVAPSHVAAGKGHTLETWMDRLPPGLVDGQGWLSYWDAVCRLGRSPARAR
jgi:ATP/maltotriose-dependent transcriptional regulator MalT